MVEAETWEVRPEAVGAGGDEAARAPDATSRSVMVDLRRMLAGALARREGLDLHDLVWSIDAKHHVVPTADELNAALRAFPAFTARRSADGIALELRSGAHEQALLTDQDIQRAISSGGPTPGSRAG